MKSKQSWSVCVCVCVCVNIESKFRLPSDRGAKVTSWRDNLDLISQGYRVDPSTSVACGQDGI